tara:strand:- start:3741 stop:4685 length:945 start_codon:yes stop_codon:yes gene_type:complete
MKVSTTTKSRPLRLYRTDLSPYQESNFKDRERTVLESHGFIYSDSLENACVLITNTHTDLSKIPTAILDNIELIIHPNSGYDNFSPKQVLALNAPIVLGNKIRAKSVSNYIISCVHNSMGEIPFTKKWQAGRQWSRRALEEATIQLIGHGHIGQSLVQSFSHLVKKIHIYDPYKNLHDLNYKADIIILCCSLNQDNQAMIDQDFLKQCREDLILINPARGKLVNTNQLSHWLTQNPKAKAYLDVFEQEPCDLSGLPSNAFCTSHIAGVDLGLDGRIIQFVEEVSLEFSRLNLSDFTAKWRNDILSHKIKADRFI